MNATMLEREYLAENNSAPLLGTSIAFLVLETIFLALLYISRNLAKGERTNLSMEILMTLTYIVCVSKITIAFLLIEIGGAGRHLRSLQPHIITNALKLSTALQIVCPLTTSLSKLGVLCMLHRIFGQASRWYRVAIRTTFALVATIMIVQVLIPFLNCRPFSKTWSPDPFSPGTCAIPGLLLWRYLGIPNVFTTLIIVGIPVPALAKLNVSRSVKFGLCIVFSVCILGIIAAIMRLQSFLQVTDFHDITYENVKPLCWTIAESGIYLVAGVMPTLRPLLRKLFKDTMYERMLTGNTRTRQSGSWRYKRFSRMWFKGEQPVPVAAKEHRSLSDASGEGVALVRAELPRISTAVERC
ncbi:Nn.00g024820.m01.CDS01 [Neocucurbitaria sp. VM-36]